MTDKLQTEIELIEQAFIDAVMDTVVSQEVGDLNLRVRDVVTIAKWLAPVHAALLAAPAASGSCDHEADCMFDRCGCVIVGCHGRTDQVTRPGNQAGGESDG